MVDDPPRTRGARAAAEQALVRVIYHYGSRPEFVLLGGLVPDLLCAESAFEHAGTTDVDIQVDLEIASASVNAPRLETALKNAEFEPDPIGIWRWTAERPTRNTVVKFELLADLDEAPRGSIIAFRDCKNLGAVNLRGTGYASKDVVVNILRSRVGGVDLAVEVNVTGLGGFLLAKTAAARERRKPKDWYDIAFVLLHNDAGGPAQAARAVANRFGDELVGSVASGLDDLVANFDAADSQGPRAYVEQMLINHPELDPKTLAADAILAVEEFHRELFSA